MKPYAWRSTFHDCISKLKFIQWEFKPYSLRRGGAAHLFVKCGSLGRLRSKLQNCIFLILDWPCWRTCKFPSLFCPCFAKFSMLIFPSHHLGKVLHRAGLGNVERSESIQKIKGRGELRVICCRNLFSAIFQFLSV